MTNEQQIQNTDDAAIDAAHKDESELTEEALDSVAGGAPNLTPISITKTTDKSSPILF